jgi:addiction module RelE/StbE family toxin
MKQLKEAMLLLIANDGPIAPEWQDHPLVGEWTDHRECHIGGDFLLIYRLESIAVRRFKLRCAKRSIVYNAVDWRPSAPSWTQNLSRRWQKDWSQT